VDVHSLEYRDRAAAILKDTPGVRDAVTGATLHFDGNRSRAYDRIDADAWRTWAAGIKGHTLTHLDRYLAQAESSLIANGVQVHWAATAGDALAVLGAIAKDGGVRRVVKGKSMLSEEIGVNRSLEGQGVEVFETDLGEYILQLLDEPPSHILGPAIHRSLDDIRALFHQRFGTPADASPEALAARARTRLREAFLTADMGITGGNFVAADTGTIALIENEGNIRLSTSIPRIHVALVGVEKLVPRWSDLAYMLQLTARAATGQPIGTFVSLIQGPRASGDDAGQPFTGERDGPEAVHVIFIDNGRSRVLADPVVWEALRCVRCGACLNACPVYRQTGGHAYGWVYSGPIGAILAPGLLGLEKTHPLPFASSLCGACAEVCPVRIDIPALLLEWRRRAVAAGLTDASEARAMKGFAAVATRPAAFRAAGAALRGMPGRVRDSLPVLSDWNASHAGIRPASPGFRSLWKRERGREAERFPVEPDENRDDTARSVDDAHTADQEAARESSAGSAGQPGAPAARRAFASGSLGPSRSALPESAANDVVRFVAEALAGRTRIAHPGPLEVSPDRSTDGPGTTDGATQGPEDGGAHTPVDRFVERFRQNGGEVVRFASAGQASAWAGRLGAEFDSCDVGLLVPEHLSPLVAGMPAAPPAEAAVGVSAAIAAAADTGTILLDSRDGRATQLLPPVHVVWIRESTIHDRLADALAAVERLPAAIGLHSGPSRSADIGRVLVTGVHGPGRVIAAVVG
jgi:L-lactate dehydrogenase complex protein LldF